MTDPQRPTPAVERAKDPVGSRLPLPSRRATVPIVASLCIHGMLLAALVHVTIAGPSSTRAERLTDAPGVETVLTLAPERSPEPIVSPAPAEQAVTPPREDADVPTPPMVVRPTTDVLVDAIHEMTSSQRPASSARVAASPPGPASAHSQPQPHPQPTTVSFAGVQASRASRVVYVVDASGPMTGSLPFVKEELARSVSRLTAAQTFQVVVFREPTAGGRESTAIQTFRGGTELLPVTEQTKVELGAWLSTIEPGGGSDLRPGIRAALAMNPSPDLVFLLTRRIRRTGNPTVAEQQVRGTLAELNLLNARDPRSGQRPTIIKALQFLDEDPTGLLPAIAREHGDAADAYRVVLPGTR